MIIDKFVANKELQRAAQTQRDDKKCVMCVERERERERRDSGGNQTLFADKLWRRHNTTLW